jgi:hypothetical protein
MFAAPFHDSPADPDQFLKILVGGTGLFLLFIVYKMLVTWAIGLVFFQKNNIKLWNQTIFSILALSGFLLFVPCLCLFFMTNGYFLCVYFTGLCFLSIEILISYKIYIIFFQHKSSLLYFILYLCTQELVPFYLLYKAFFCFFIS